LLFAGWVAASAVMTEESTAREVNSGVTPASGEFTLLTYNVAGLPELVSQSTPATNTPFIGNLLNLYDVAVVQEDFAYHDALSGKAAHPYRTQPLVPSDKVGIGDGLNVFSRFSFRKVERVPWHACNGTFSDGSDCFAPKGFALATQVIDSGITIDLYDVHMDSGYAPADIATRALQVDQLLAYMAHHSVHHAVIVAGDTNMGHESDEILRRLLERAGLTDACRSLSCPEPDRIDRVMYRGARGLDLQAEKLAIDDRFVRSDGKDLSDHKALGVVFKWRRVPLVTQTSTVARQRGASAKTRS
jgi:endonuclease/exonuclease/phosphatase (EEP) superfamily protein YafD